MEIFRLFGSILVDSSEADKSIQKTGDNAKSLASKLGSGLKTVGKVAGGIATATAGAASAAGAAIYSLTNDTAAAGDNIDKMSQKLGLSRESFQELDFVLSQSGTDINSFQTGMKSLLTNMDKVIEGNEAATENFDKLGVSVQNADGTMRSQEEVFFDTVKAFQSMEDSAEKSRLAQELFGKQGQEILPLLNAEAGSLEDMREQAHELGLVMSDEAVDSAVKFTDTLDQLKRGLSATKNSIGAALLPIVQKFADKLIKLLPTIQKFVEKLLPPIENLSEAVIDIFEQLIDELLPPVLDLIDALLPPITEMIDALLPVIVDLLNKLVPIITDIIKELLPPLVDILNDLMPIIDILFELLEPILDVIKAIISPLGKILKAIEPIISKTVELVEKALQPFEEEIKGATDDINKLLGPALDYIADILEKTVLPMFEAVISFFEGDWSKGVQNAGTAFVNAFKSAFELIDGLFGTNLAGWYSQVTKFFNGFGSYLYSMSHQGQIDENALHSKYSSTAQDVRLAANEYMRNGMSADEALNKAKAKYLGSNTEALYYWDNYGNYDAAQAYANIQEAEANERARLEEIKKKGEEYRNHYMHLATGGLVYGDTLAVVGDNADAARNPEVVAPLSDLSAMIADALSAVINKPSEQTIIVQLSDGTELTRALVNNINDLTRQDGRCVIRGV